jgi:hypothetical protein
MEYADGGEEDSFSEEIDCDRRVGWQETFAEGTSGLDVMGKQEGIPDKTNNEGKEEHEGTYRIKHGSTALQVGPGGRFMQSEAQAGKSQPSLQGSRCCSTNVATQCVSPLGARLVLAVTKVTHQRSSATSTMWVATQTAIDSTCRSSNKTLRSPDNFFSPR